MEIENRLVISRVKEEVRVDVTIQGQQEGILKMMKMFCILTVSTSISWLCHWTIVLQDVTTEKNWVKGTQNFCTLFFYNCKRIYNYFKMKRLKT